MQTRSRFARELIASSLLVTSLFAAPLARALPRPELYTADIVHPEIAIPGNGVLVVTSPGSEPPAITVAPSDDPTALISGTTARAAPAVSTYWTWKPDVELAPGTYTVTTQVSSIAVVTTTTITVIEPMAIDLPEIEAMATLGEKLMLDQFSCCSHSPNEENKPCFGETLYREPRLDLVFGTTAPSELTHQFLFVVYDFDHLSAHASYHLIVEPPGSVSIVSERRSDEYCYRFHAYDLTTGEMHEYTDLEPLCVPHGTFGEVGWQPFELRSGDEELLERDRCPNPPPGLRAEWCAINMSACEGLSGEAADDSGCRYYDFACHDGPPPTNQVSGGAGGASGTMSEPPSSGGTGGASGGGSDGNGSQATGGSGAGGAAGMASAGGSSAAPHGPNTEMTPSAAAPANSSSGAGCSAADSPGASSSFAAFWLLALIALRARRSATR